MTTSLHENRGEQQHKRACELLEGLIQPPVRRLRSVLDVGCGQGYWARDVARYYPFVKVVAIDHNAQVLHQAQSLLKTERFPNLSFQCLDITQPLDLPEHEFDLVFVRYVFLHLPKSDWQTVMRSLAKHVCPGGYLQLVDGGLERATTPAWNELIQIFSRLLQTAGQDAQVAMSFAPLLVNSGFTLYNCAYHPLTTGHWSEENFPASDALGRYMKARSLIAKTGFMDLGYYDDLLRRAEKEAELPEFLAIGGVTSAIGQKPPK